MMDQYPICIGKDKKITIIGGINVLDGIDEAVEIGMKFKEACKRIKSPISLKQVLIKQIEHLLMAIEDLDLLKV